MGAIGRRLSRGRDLDVGGVRGRSEGAAGGGRVAEDEGAALASADGLPASSGVGCHGATNWEGA